MKNTPILFPCFAAILVLLTSVAFAQTQEQTIPAASDRSLLAAHCQYTLEDSACLSSGGSGQSATTMTIDDNTLAQYPRRMPGPPRAVPRRPMAYPPGSYPGMMPAPSGRHALIGAAIGFGLGAAIGSKRNAGTSLTIGALGALIGAGIGLATPSYRTMNRYRRGPWPDDDDESASKTSPAKSGSKRVATRSRDERHTTDLPDSRLTSESVPSKTSATP